MLRRREATAATATAAAGDARIVALERLGTLRESGVLDEDEFKAEKARILAAG
jgi:hypothetical protein